MQNIPHDNLPRRFYEFLFVFFLQEIRVLEV